MAAVNTGRSGHFDLTSDKAGITLRLYWVETYNTETNTSVVTITDMQAKSSAWYGVSYFLDGSVTVDGVSIVDFVKADYEYYLYWGALNTFASVRVQGDGLLPPWAYQGIEHNEDGTKTVNIGVNVSGYTATGGADSGWTVYGTVAVELTTIPVPEPEPDPDPVPEPEPLEPRIIFYFGGREIFAPRFNGAVVCAGVLPLPYIFGDAVTVSGTTIRVDDVADKVHDLQIKTTAGTEVKVYGKNLANPSIYTTDGNKSVVVYVGDGVLKHRATATGAAGVDVNGTRVTLQMLCPDIEVGKTYTLNATTTCESKKYIYLQGNYNKTWAFGKSLTITEAMLTDGVLWYAMGDRVDVFISNIQIEEGTAATAYEPYKAPQTATADENGNVTGLKSVSPTMTVVGTDTVECTYFSQYVANAQPRAEQIEIREDIENV